MDVPETVVDALRLLADEGYETEFQLRDGRLRCNEDGTECSVTDARVSGSSASKGRATRATR